MNYDLLLEASKLFEIPEKWNAFNELSNNKNRLMDFWWRKLQKEVQTRELQYGHADWSFYAWNSWDMMWFVRGDKNDSFAVHYWGKTLRVCGYGGINQGLLRNLLKEYRFDIIRRAFDRIDGENNDSYALEEGNFHFGTTSDGNFSNVEELSWYAGNETSKYADQLIEKVRKFQTPEILELFKEINKECRVK